MTTMLERAARAVNDAEARWSLEPTGTRSEMITRAVLMSVREPDEATQNAGVNAASNVFGGWADEGQVIEYHHAIIDAILADGEGR